MDLSEEHGRWRVAFGSREFPGSQNGLKPRRDGHNGRLQVHWRYGESRFLPSIGKVFRIEIEAREQPVRFSPRPKALVSG
jgi:hypothetical protein